MKTIGLILFSLFMFFFSPNARGQENEEFDTISKSFKQAILGYQLTIYGYENNSPISLIDAAYILHKINPGKPEIEKSLPGEGMTSSKEALGYSTQPLDLVKKAKELAQGNSNLIAICKQAEKEIGAPARGSVYGPKSIKRRVHGNEKYVDYIVMEPEELAQIAVVGDGDTDLDLMVYDDQGNLIASDDSPNDKCYVQFSPGKRIPYKIVVKNNGNLFNDYILITN
jgi:hypothetical protein